MFHHLAAAVAAAAVALTSPGALWPQPTGEQLTEVPQSRTVVAPEIYSPQASPTWPRSSVSTGRLARATVVDEARPSGVHQPGFVARATTPLAHPLTPSARISSVYGWRVNPTGLGDPIQFHIGQDFAVMCGTPVRAAASGTVTWAGWKGTAGLRVDIEHAGGMATAYRHNSVILRQPGDQVESGDVIALVGSTGNSTGCHLHFEVTVDGKYVNPAHLLPGGLGATPRTTDHEDHAIRTALEAQRRGDVRSEPSEASAPRVRAAAPAPRSSEPTRPPRADQTAPARQRAATPRGASEAPSGTTKPSASAPPSASVRPRPAARPAPAPVPAPPTAGPVPQPTPVRPPAPSPAPVRPTPPPLPSPTPVPPTPSPGQPVDPAPTDPPSLPGPVDPPVADPVPSPDPGVAPVEETLPAAPELLTDVQAAQWCLTAVSDDDPDAPALPAHLDAQGLPVIASETLLALLSPSAEWLDALPSCTDEEFLAAAEQAREEDPDAALQPRVPADEDETVEPSAD